MERVAVDEMGFRGRRPSLTSLRLSIIIDSVASNSPDHTSNLPMLEGAAEELLQAFLQGHQCPPVASRYGIDLAGAYAVQERIVEGRRAARGEHPVGFKLGLTNSASRERLGAVDPVFAPVLSGSLQQAPGTISLAELHQARLEVEIAFVAHRDLPASVAPRDVIAYCDVAVGFEINASRIAYKDRSTDVTLVDLVADQCLAAHFVVGPAQHATSRSIDDLALELTVDGDDVATGHASVVMGSPLAAMAWLCRALGARGLQLRAGDVAFTGNTLGAGRAMHPGTYTARSALGQIDCTIV
jgi:2-keto-4-pentenoate hydratase